MRIYLSGPMTGMVDHNYPTFNAVAARLRSLGHYVFNPAESFEGDQSRSFAEYMETDLAKIIFDVDTIAVLPGWANSKGAMLEVAVGVALGRTIVYADTLAPRKTTLNAEHAHLIIGGPHEVTYTAPQETILEEAQRICGGDRQHAYGPPDEDFTRTGKMWAAILGLEKVTAQQVALCMIALKLSRETHQRKRDNATDIAGYAYCLDRINQQHAAEGKV